MAIKFKSASLIIFGLILALWLAQTKTVHDSWSESSRLAAIQSLVERGTWRIDASPYGQETGDKILLNGHYYSSKPPLFAALGAGLYGLMYYGWQARLVFAGCQPGPFCVYYWLTVILVGLPSALMAAYLYRLLERTVTVGWAIALTALFCFGTSIWPYSLTLNNHIPAAAALFLSFYLLLTPELNRSGLVGAGLLAGLAVMLDLTAVFMAFALFLIVAVYQRKGLLFFVTAATLPLIPTLIFNYQITGGGLFPYFETAGYDYPGSVFNTLGGQHPPDNIWVYTLRNFVGDYGLLTYCPLLLFAGWGLVKMIQNKGYFLFGGALRLPLRTMTRVAPTPPDGGNTPNNQPLLAGKSALILLGLLAHTAFVLAQTHNFGGDAYGGRYFIPIIPILYVFIARIIPSRFYQPYGGWIAGLAGLAALVSLFSAYQGVRSTWHQVAPPFYIAWLAEAPYLAVKTNLALPDKQPNGFAKVTRVHNFDVPPLTHRLDLNLNGEVALLGYDMPSRRVEPGQSLQLTLYWQLLSVVRGDYFVFTHLLDADQNRQGGLDRRLQEGYPVNLWYPGEVVVDQRQIPVAPAAPNGLVWLRLGGYESVAGQAQPLPLSPANGQSQETSLAIGPILIGPSPQIVKPDHFTPATTLALELGEPPLIELRGYDLTQKEAGLELTLYWESLAETPLDWTTFVHLRNQAGEIVAQKDGQTGGGLLPTSLWQVGEIVADPVLLSLPAGLAAGEYTLVGGVYRPDTGQRLALPGSADNSFELTSFKVVPRK